MKLLFVLFIILLPLYLIISAICDDVSYVEMTPDEERVWLKSLGLTEQEIKNIMEE